MYVIKIDGMKVPLKIFSEENSIESQCIEQMVKVSSLPFLYKHVALMPDGHWGMGASIGAVVATRNVVVPSLIGVDIGCGMIAVQTNITEIGLNEIKEVISGIRQAIPVGFKKHLEYQNLGLMPAESSTLDLPVIPGQFGNARKSLGTLGGGNHFIEIQKGSDGFVWVMIHSGSRNLGKKVADYHNKVAKDLNGKWFSQVPKEWDLAFLPLDSKEGQSYLDEMNYCVSFALANRQLMMERVVECIKAVIDGVIFEGSINIAHNYAAMEHHFGQNVMVHRKGATKAYKGKLGIIPGSQGTASYIVRGKGDPRSFMSCSHGAGRKMGRKQAQRELNFDMEKKRLDDLGIVHSIKDRQDLDEAPGAYKDISEVMANQADLVDIVIELKPLAVIKG